MYTPKPYQGLTILLRLLWPCDNDDDGYDEDGDFFPNQLANQVPHADNLIFSSCIISSTTPTISIVMSHNCFSSFICISKGESLALSMKDMTTENRECRVFGYDKLKDKKTRQNNKNNVIDGSDEANGIELMEWKGWY